MKKEIIGIIVCMLVLPTFAGAMSSTNTSTESIDNEPVDRTYSHTILGEYGTRAGCVPCYYAHTALKNIYANGWHPFYYVTLVCSKNIHAYQRAINELGLIAYPTVFWDGDYRKNLGASSIQSAMERYNYSITKCGERTVADIDLSLDVTWLGAVNNDPEDGATVVNLEKVMSWTISEMMINVTVDNNEASQYNGHLHVYVTEIESSMGWKDNEGNPYTFAFLNYAFNEDIGISAGGTWDDSTGWDGVDHYDGHGHSFENVTQNNTMVIAAVFDENSDYTDETAGFVTGVGTDPKTFDIYFGNSTPPSKAMSNVSIMYFVPEVGLEFNTTYYWKVDVWDALGNPTYGQIWNFTTRDNDPPYTPSNPDPANGATGVTINTNLSWTGGDPDGDDTTYDVYFGTSSPPPLVALNYNDTVYDPPGILQFNTMYYWKIVAWDEYGLNASGPVWTFTTQANLPPYEPSNPEPEDGANNVPVDAILKWNGSDPNPGDPLTYDVYFGVTNPPTQKSSNQTGNSYDPLGDIELFKTYYWYIVSWDSQGLSTYGDIWSFTTGVNNPPDKPTITGPKEGTAGEDYEYNFSTSDPENQDIAYKIQWGDGVSTDWTDWLPSGTKITRNHTWDEKDDYIIRCKARDIYNEESEWGALEVTMPKNKAFNFNFNLLSWLFERFPHAFLVMRHLLGLL